jgi:hypothetical protein
MHGPINVKSPNNISKWQMGFNLAFKGLKCVKFEMRQYVSTSEGNIQASGVKYVKGVIYIIITIVYIFVHLFYTSGLNATV